jgi:hypothetical protein
LAGYVIRLTVAVVGIIDLDFPATNKKPVACNPELSGNLAAAMALQLLLPGFTVARFSSARFMTLNLY